MIEENVIGEGEMQQQDRHKAAAPADGAEGVAERGRVDFGGGHLWSGASNPTSAIFR